MKGITPIIIILLLVVMAFFMFPAILYPPEKTIETNDLQCAWWSSGATLSVSGNTAEVCVPESSIFLEEDERAGGGGSCRKLRYAYGARIPSGWENARLVDSTLRLYTLEGFEKYYGEYDYNRNSLMILRDGFGFALPLNPADNTKFDSEILGTYLYLEGCVTLEKTSVVTTTTTTIPVTTTLPVTTTTTTTTTSTTTTTIPEFRIPIVSDIVDWVIGVFQSIGNLFVT